jgi:cell division GTPase FtsZ
MSLFLDGSLVDGTTFGSGAGTQPNIGQAIVTVADDDVLTLRNHTTTAAIGLTTPIGGTEETTNASVVIEKIG